ncbi:MAG: 5'-deoxynucleotidase [Firmicutes bacterium]|nr:5'-deoxynucleotidase [Bacillota bacterium]
MGNHFFAYLSRMKLIKRWSLMRNLTQENIAEHSLQVALIAQALAFISNAYFADDIDCGEITQLALFHDAGEVLIGDLPTPVKYYNPQINDAYKQIEEVAKDKLLCMLPPELAQLYKPLLFSETHNNKRLIKAADKIAAYLKCVEESAAGNGEFILAEEATLKEISHYEDIPAVGYFMEHFAPSFSKTLDELG